MGTSLITSDSQQICPYNIGDIYITTLSTSPENIWKDTKWEKISNCFLRASDDNCVAGTTGGSWTHTQTVDEIAKHSPFLPNANTNGSVTVPAWGCYISNTSVITGTTENESYNHNGYSLPVVGRSKPMDITNKYLSVNMWKRIE